MSSDQPIVNFRPGDWETPVEGTSHSGQFIALVEGAVITSTVSNGVRTMTFKKGTIVTLTINQGNPLATWNPDYVLIDTHTA